MIELLKESLWKQFGASIDMFKNAVERWPEEQWHADERIFYMVYHTLFFLEYYLTFPPKDFAPRLPVTLTRKEDVPIKALDDLIPSKTYSRKELLEYLEACRTTCKQSIADLTADSMAERWVEEPGNPKTRNYSRIELLMYNMRHVQHHAAQLNLLLRQQINEAPRWVSRAKDNF